MDFKYWETSYSANRVLRNVYLFEASGAAQSDTKRFWLSPNPSEPFYSWLQQNQVDFQPGILPRFVDGGSGRAYFVGDKVVKFTRNRVEANVAKAAIGQDAPAAVINVWRIPGGEPLWAILQKYVNVNVEQELKDAADIATALMDDLREKNPNFTHFNNKQKQFLAKQALQRYGKPMTLLPYVVSAMDAINQLYFRTGFTHDDAGPTNIGRDMSTGNIVFHDLGPNLTKNFKPRDMLDKIHQNRAALGLPALAEV